jgi:hypothetical protein
MVTWYSCMRFHNTGQQSDVDCYIIPCNFAALTFRFQGSLMRVGAGAFRVSLIYSTALFATSPSCLGLGFTLNCIRVALSLSRLSRLLCTPAVCFKVSISWRPSCKVIVLSRSRLVWASACEIIFMALMLPRLDTTNPCQGSPVLATRCASGKHFTIMTSHLGGMGSWWYGPGQGCS